ncbi:energy transducer TonB [Hymenobacter metallicola]|uniref:Energy transducer TonB n=1 Tax=Hymenobacter metallicola TaxID=2563114 RepID=A0A4Z0QA58_9BACT|nr:energy transducer TonB [Hymenobacter metallicola]TGE26269.1 energy transducer TonB [Hymenobacter metallicola]
MNTTNLHTASFDEIVFEGRNKAYGAFVLRQLYNRHLARALAITVALCLLLVSIPMVVQRLWPSVTLPSLNTTHDDDAVVLTEIVLPKQKIETPTATVAPPAPVVVTPRNDIPTKVVKDDEVTKPVPTTEVTQVNDNVLTETQPGSTVGGSVTGVIGGAKTGNDSGAVTPAAPAKPFEYAEVMPEFAGGQKALQQYMQRNLRFPRQALANAVSGKVFVSFTVQADGSISDVQVVKGLGYGTDEEAARVVGKMPAWTPGRQNSRPVAVRYTLPITFQYE